MSHCKTGSEDICEIKFRLISLCWRFLLNTVKSLEIKCCSATFKRQRVSVAWMHPSHPRMYIVKSDEEVFISLLRREPESARRSGKEDVLKSWLSPVLRFFISEEFRLWSPWQSVRKNQRSMKYLHSEPLLHKEDTVQTPPKKDSITLRHSQDRLSQSGPFKRQAETYLHAKNTMDCGAFAASVKHEDCLAFISEALSMPGWTTHPSPPVMPTRLLWNQCVSWPGMFPPAFASSDATCFFFFFFLKGFEVLRNSWIL